jgi:hypothetical protein
MDAHQRKLLRLANQEALVLMIGPTAIVTDTPVPLLARAWQAMVDAKAAGELPESLEGLLAWSPSSACRRCWAWWQWSAPKGLKRPDDGDGHDDVAQALVLLEAGVLEDAEIDCVIASAEGCLDSSDREVHHGKRSDVVLAEALIEATDRPPLRPYTIVTAHDEGGSLRFEREVVS